jgi:hypothetical protein
VKHQQISVPSLSSSSAAAAAERLFEKFIQILSFNPTLSHPTSDLTKQDKKLVRTVQLKDH